MGTQSSKIDKVSAARALGQKQTQDDLMSKSTEMTEDSSLPPSPAITFFKSSKVDKQQRKSPTRRINHISAKDQLSSSNHTPSPIERSSSQTDTRRTVPVKCPPRKIGDTAPDTSQHSCDDVQYLMKMYDSRTWEMYRRITEARKNSSYECNSAPMNNTRNENTNEWENLKHDHLDTLPSGHEMIFLFDFD